MKRKTLKKQLRRWAESEASIMGAAIVRDGERWTISTGGADDEGWSSKAIIIDVRTGIVSQIHDGRDCDGRLTQVYVNRFMGIDGKHTAWVRRELGDEYRRAVSARWAELSRDQRDEFAEMAGY